MANNKKEAEAPKAKKDFSKLGNGLTGLGMLLVVASIAWSSYVTISGLQDVERFVLVAPQVIFAGVVLVKQFTK